MTLGIVYLLLPYSPYSDNVLTTFIVNDYLIGFINNRKGGVKIDSQPIVSIITLGSEYTFANNQSVRTIFI